MGLMRKGVPKKSGITNDHSHCHNPCHSPCTRLSKRGHRLLCVAHSICYPATCGPKGHGSGIVFLHDHITSQTGIAVIIGLPDLLPPRRPKKKRKTETKNTNVAGLSGAQCPDILPQPWQLFLGSSDEGSSPLPSSCHSACFPAPAGQSHSMPKS